MYLVKFEYNYADEFDVTGWRLMNQERMDKFNEGIEKAKYPRECYFGTNEALVLETKEDILSALEIIEINDMEANVLETLIGKSHGFVPYCSDWPSYDG